MEKEGTFRRRDCWHSLLLLLPIFSDNFQTLCIGRLRRQQRQQRLSRFLLLVLYVVIMIFFRLQSRNRPSRQLRYFFCSSFVGKRVIGRERNVISGQSNALRRQVHPAIVSVSSPLSISRAFHPFHRTTLNVQKKKLQWSVGDMVVVATADSSTPLISAHIVSVQGAGWYSVQLSNSSNNEIVKVRSSQLRSVHELVDSTTKDNNNNNATGLALSFVAGPTLEADPGRPPLFSPPAPLIQDLDSLVKDIQTDPGKTLEVKFQRQVAHHSKYKKWVVFTDLHCSPATLQTSMQVLDVVHSTALQCNAGVLFLGDFWHHRGTLRVDCLNAVLKALEAWEVPMVMIPGNHDQISLGGYDHGLTPLANAYRVFEEDHEEGVAGPLILSHPTVFRKGLFVPHIRDIATMESVLQSHHAKDAKALFVHAEVKGALMNDLLVSTHGIPPSSFPSHKSIYSGHFHKPHTVQSSITRGRDNQSSTVSIEYLGSPYEISLAEAEQEKQLVVLDEHWQVEQRIPLSLGRKHFKLSSWEELSLFHLYNDTERSGKKILKKGDRVVVSLPSQWREYPRDLSNISSFNEHVQMLRSEGVMVEVREDNTCPFPTMLPINPFNDPLPEEMTPESTWRAYLKDAEKRELINEEITDILVETGLKILEEVEEDSLDRNQEEKFDVKLIQTTVHGFGPFRESVTYPLLDRGLVLLRGKNTDLNRA
jgi:DNA repair exonuclease SbcCD nuclease subunit